MIKAFIRMQNVNGEEQHVINTVFNRYILQGKAG